jgi:membrane-associated phospholipid phosphatase
MHVLRLTAASLVIVAIAVPCWAQESQPSESTLASSDASRATPDGGAAPQLTGLGRPLTGLQAPPTESNNFFKMVGGDFKNFFSTDTAHTLSYAAVAAVATMPWDRQGVNNGFGISTETVKSGNLIGQFVVQASAGAATWGVGRMSGNQKLAAVGRDIVRAQIVSQSFVQVVKHTVQRQRPDGSNNASFPSGHSASGFATAAVLQRHYGWKVGAPAYALGTYIAMSRVAWNHHHVSDVVMGAGFGIASARSVTMSVGKTRFSMGVQPQVGGASVNFTKIQK